ncbi:hypothetical protein [Micromonospora sp. RTGN7]|uniref:hypothetical protein n=1 Tax=Micromonospora sp. RTGN7 TaxID=3016526 RepID=UPI0029FF1ACC|nr:hypothetical protein [Micromonospora sp. RTGN7]
MRVFGGIFPIAITVALLTTGCSTGSGGDSGAVKNYDEALKEYNAAKSSLTLPANKSWDSAQKLRREADGSQVVFQDGAATGKVESFWLCAWQQEWLAARGNDAQREKQALDNLGKFTTLRTYQKDFDQGSRDIFDDELAKARLGDPSVVQQSVKANCAKV